MKKVTIGALVFLLMAGLILMGCGEDGNLLPGIDVPEGNEGDVIVLPSVPKDDLSSISSITLEEINEMIEKGETPNGSPFIIAQMPDVEPENCEGKLIYLKGKGKDTGFNVDGWQNIYVMPGYYKEGSSPNVWHLVYSADLDGVEYMQVTFVNGEVFRWVPGIEGMDLSVNGGGNNQGWVLVAPWDWSIAYIDQGNNKNISESYVIATNDGQFNISGFSKGSEDGGGKIVVPPVTPPPPDTEFGWLDTTGDLMLMEEYMKEYYTPVYKTKTAGNNEKTLTNRGSIFENQINMIEISKAELEAGFMFEVAVSANNSGKDPGTGIWATATFEGVEFKPLEEHADAFIADSFKSDYSLILFSSNPKTDKININPINKHGNKVYDQRKDKDAEVIYLLFHNAGGLTYTVYTDVVDYWVFDYEEGPFTREYTGDIEAIVTITNEAGEVFEFGEDLVPGEYLITISWNGIDLITKTVEVVAGETTYFDFSDPLVSLIVTVLGDPVKIYNE